MSSKPQADKVAAGHAVAEQTLPLWEAPLASMKTFSVREFTRVDSFPGVDGSSPTTHS